MPKLFLGGLGNDCRERDIEKLFRGFGELRNINIKGQFGFLEIDDKRDAEDAIRDVNGQSFNGGSRIRVEFANGNDRGGDRDRRGGGDRRDGDRRGDRYQDTRGRQVSDGKFKRSNYRLIVENISSRTSWQDLKDYMRKAGDITYTTVNRGKAGTGLVEFVDREGMEYALKELDDTKLDDRRIRLVEEKRSPSRSRSRSNRRGNRRSESNGRGNRRSESNGRGNRRSESNGRGNRRSESNGKRSMDRGSQEKAKRQRSATPEQKSRSRSGDPAGDQARSDSKQRNVERRSPEKTRRQASKTPDKRSRSRSDDRVRNDDKQRSYSKSPKSGNKSERE
eukprot:GFUD01043543.1.p1 GENE.GFUD01043543.1~~GFUD01043543.1.p1  ORF type:complete len:336 (+),score=95.69 GFUD01043543.1:50-1057(+)